MTKRLLSTLSDVVKTQDSIDIISLLVGYSVDTLSAYLYGLPQGTNFVENEAQRRNWFKIYLEGQPSESEFWLLELPTMTRWLRALGFHLVSKKYLSAKRWIEDWGLAMVDKTEAAFLQSKTIRDANCPDRPTVYAQLRNTLTAQGTKESFDFADHRAELASETLDHIVATIDIFSPSPTSIASEQANQPRHNI